MNMFLFEVCTFGNKILVHSNKQTPRCVGRDLGAFSTVWSGCYLGQSGYIINQSKVFDL